MENNKFTPKEKRKVLKDWKEEIPTLSQYKLGNLLNMIGPILVGVNFEYNGFQTKYKPSCFVHNLSLDFSSISITLRKEGKWIGIENHEQMYKEQVDILKKETFIPFEGDLSLDTIIKGYENYFLHPTNIGQIAEFDDLALIRGWCKEQKN